MAKAIGRDRGALTLLNTVLLGSLCIGIISGSGDALSTLVVVVLGRVALLGLLALCDRESAIVKNFRRRSNPSAGGVQRVSIKALH